MRDAIKRNYEDAVSIDSSRTILVGDFNGDNSEDVAVVVRPGQGKIAELNSEYVNWILEDPHQAPAAQQKVRPARPSIRPQRSAAGRDSRARS